MSQVLFFSFTLSQDLAQVSGVAIFFHAAILLMWVANMVEYVKTTRGRQTFTADGPKAQQWASALLV